MKELFAWTLLSITVLAWLACEAATSAARRRARSPRPGRPLRPFARKLLQLRTLGREYDDLRDGGSSAPPPGADPSAVAPGGITLFGIRYVPAAEATPAPQPASTQPPVGAPALVDTSVPATPSVVAEE